MKIKWCPKCEQELSIAEFGEDRSRGDGLQCYCKECRRGCYRESYSRNPEEPRRRGRKYYKENRDKRLLRMREYHNTVTGRLRGIFSAVKHRCDNPECKDFKYYGGRGIENKFKSSNEFVDYVVNNLHVDPRGLEIDRIDNDGHYEKGNVRFVTHKENSNNRRKRRVATCKIL